MTYVDIYIYHTLIYRDNRVVDAVKKGFHTEICKIDGDNTQVVGVT